MSHRSWRDGTTVPAGASLPIRSVRGFGRVALAVAFFAAGVMAGWTGWVLSQEDHPGWTAEVISENRQAVNTQMAALDARLHDLLEDLGSARQMEAEARMLAGLDPFAEFASVEPRTRFLPATCIGDEDLAKQVARAEIHLEVALQEASSLNDSYSEVLVGMEDLAEEWAASPTILPVDCARMTSSYGSRRDPITGRRSSHSGMDLAAPYGTPIRASATGTVVKAGWIRGYGKMVELDHGNGIVTRYAHNSRILVSRGEKVRRGQKIAKLGGTGRVNAPHLHYEVVVNGHRANPHSHTLALTE